MMGAAAHDSPKLNPAVQAFLEWLRVSTAKRWLLVGTQAMSIARVALASFAPESVVVLIGSDNGHGISREGLTDPRVTFETTTGDRLPWELGRFEVVITTGLLERTAQPLPMLMELARVTKLNGIVAACVVSTDNPSPLLDRRALWGLWLDARLNDVTTTELDADGVRGWGVRGSR